MAAVPGYYTIKEAAPIIGRSEQMVRKYVREGLLPAKDLGHQHLIEQENVLRFVPPPRGNPNFRNRNTG